MERIHCQAVAMPPKLFSPMYKELMDFFSHSVVTDIAPPVLFQNEWSKFDKAIDNFDGLIVGIPANPIDDTIRHLKRGITPQAPTLDTTTPTTPTLKRQSTGSSEQLSKAARLSMPSISSASSAPRSSRLIAPPKANATAPPNPLVGDQQQQQKQGEQKNRQTTS